MGRARCRSRLSPDDGVDYFKKINDTHGHEAGDQALVHVARLLKEVAGERGLPIRYGGDEFMILMPDGCKDEAMTLGEGLLKRMHAEPLRLEKGSELHLTLSIGVATAPEDAQTSKALVQKADTALYQAKQAGRDRVANVSDEQHVISDKVALQQLSSGMICSREEQLGQVEGVSRLFDQGQSQFVLVEGGSGMGKTTFLDATRRMLQGMEAYLVRTAGSMQENYRPYYLMASILAPAGLLRFRKRWPADVRAAAAYALAQISDPRAAKALARLANETDPRLKQLARTAAKK